MPENVCPNCGSSAARAIATAPASMDVNYHRCGACGHVWTTSKDGSRIVTHVTPLTADTEQEMGPD